MKKIKLSSLIPNEENPRHINEENFKKLTNSLNKFPKMMNLRPIIIDENNIIVGGNMRHKALVALGYNEIPGEWVKMAKDFTPEELREFIIKDNVGFGEWDWDELANNWDADKLSEWGLEIPGFEKPIDDDSDENENDHTISIDFNREDYDEAVKKVDFWQNTGLYIGGFLIDKLNELSINTTEKQPIEYGE